MTGKKRAGKRTCRNGSQKAPTGPGESKKPDTITKDDHLTPEQSRHLELTAIQQGWVLGAEQSKRDNLVAKVLNHAMKQNADINDVLKVFRAISIAEQRQQMIELRRQANELRKQYLDLKNNPDNPTMAGVESASEPTKAHEVIAKLIASRKVRQALDSRSPSTKKADALKNATESIKIAGA